MLSSLLKYQFIILNFLFQETYPQSPPVWFSESDDSRVSEAVAVLANTSGIDNHILYQVSSAGDVILISCILQPVAVAVLAKTNEEY